VGEQTGTVTDAGRGYREYRCSVCEHSWTVTLDDAACDALEAREDAAGGVFLAVACAECEGVGSTAAAWTPGPLLQRMRNDDNHERGE
jgi:hypothetical protein